MFFKKPASEASSILGAMELLGFQLLWVLLGHAPDLGSSFAFGCLPSAPPAALYPSTVCSADTGDCSFLLHKQRLMRLQEV